MLSCTDSTARKEVAYFLPPISVVTIPMYTSLLYNAV